MIDIDTELKPIKVGSYYLKIKKRKTIYDKKTVDFLFVGSVYNNKMQPIGKDGKVVEWGTDAKTFYYNKRSGEKFSKQDFKEEFEMWLHDKQLYINKKWE